MLVVLGIVGLFREAEVLHDCRCPFHCWGAQERPGGAQRGPYRRPLKFAPKAVGFGEASGGSGIEIKVASRSPVFTLGTVGSAAATSSGRHCLARDTSFPCFAKN
jgi:hypothetical protein